MQGALKSLLVAEPNKNIENSWFEMELKFELLKKKFFDLKFLGFVLGIIIR